MVTHCVFCKFSRVYHKKKYWTTRNTLTSITLGQLPNVLFQIPDIESCRKHVSLGSKYYKVTSINAILKKVFRLVVI